MTKRALIAATLYLLTATAGVLNAADPVIPYTDEPVPPVEQIGIWGAIAYSQADGMDGFFWGADKKPEAEEEALEHCRNAGGKSCDVVQVFRNHRHWNDDDGSGFPYNHCAALAVDSSARHSSSAWGVASAASRSVAEQEALAQCGASSKECRIHEWVCT
ncbi:DUF4189 domain-containing protein [Agrobacterium rhizogenes]|nr:DUF4189 domain-containing protein [Rhizobium rhizogenes]NTH66594.1 DUF4189 domain-containing protein [Rhizobium rhizogenes]